jgi:hypothetical protein
VEYADYGGRSDKQDRLIAAKAHLNTVLSGSRQVSLALVLHSRVTLRLREPLNWEPIDNAFEVIIGGDYAGTVGRFLDRRHYGETKGLNTIGDRIRAGVEDANSKAHRNEFLDKVLDMEAGKEGVAEDAVPAVQLSVSDLGASDEDLAQLVPDLIGELILADFTSVSLLSGLGKLYVDRAVDLTEHHVLIHGMEPAPNGDIAREAAEYARRAYDCFDACRILQEAQGVESIVTKFERGRAVTLAAKFLNNPNPFPWSVLQARTDQVTEAVRLLLDARGHSVASFNRVCSRAVADNNDVQVRLGLRKPLVR